jgi:hypothetical protein
MFSILTKFHMPSSSGSLVITMKPRTELNYRTAAMFYSYCLKVYFHTSLQDLNLNVASTAKTSQVRGTSTVLIIGNLKS